MAENEEHEVVDDGVHSYTQESKYCKPEQKKVNDHLTYFGGLKLGFMMHWAPVSQLGIVESWALSDGDADWSRTDIDWTDSATFKEQYRQAHKTFNPVRFRPDKMALLAKECGFKYLLFTTKHHDGFCMYDTKTTDYKITNPDCPYSTNPNANIVKRLYDEFRKQGLAISVYFSKPDWDNNDYWCKEYGDAPTRNVNYDVLKEPEKWNRFVEFTHEQIRELCTDYGKVDVLWLDGGWVNPRNRGQDIKLEEIVDEIRSTSQPHLIVCDRTVGGKLENIVTPEQTIPSVALNIPWESCITLGHSFAFHYTEKYKSAHEVIHTFLDIVAKGGNLALNIAPQPNGEIPGLAVAILREMGQWLGIHEEAIYDTHIQAPYINGRFKYTAKEDKIYVFYLYSEAPKLQYTIRIPLQEKISKVSLIRTKEAVPFIQGEGWIDIDASAINIASACYADCFKLVKK